MPAAAKTSAKAEKETIGGAEVVRGKDRKLTQVQQAQIARGELDEDLNEIEDEKKEGTSTKGATAANAALTDKEKATDIKVDEIIKQKQETAPEATKVKGPLYAGPLTVTGTSGETGEPVSCKYTQEAPVTEEGVFYAFRNKMGPTVLREIKIDPTNTEDPTLRTSREGVTAGGKPVVTGN